MPTLGEPEPPDPTDKVVCESMFGSQIDEKDPGGQSNRRNTPDLSSALGEDTYVHDRRRAASRMLAQARYDNKFL